MTKRPIKVYAHTSVYGGVFDEEFAVASQAFLIWFARENTPCVIFHDHSATCFSRPFHQARRSEMCSQPIT